MRGLPAWLRRAAPRRPLGDLLADWPNPVVVKELRQAVNGRFVGGILMALLAVQLTVIAFALLGEDLAALDRARGLGRQLFTALQGVLTFTALLAMPLYVGGRTVSERSGAQLDLLYATTLPPRQIVGGKLQAVAILAGLLYVAQLPLISLCYLLRGIDLPSMGALVAGSYLLVINAAAVSLLVACMPAGRVARVFSAFALLAGLLIAAGMGTAFVAFAMDAGVAARLGTWEVWRVVLVVLLIDALALRLVFLLAVAMISPPVGNRALPLRRFLVGLWVLTLAIAVAASLLTARLQPLRAWVMAATWALAPLLLTAAGGRDRPSRPVLRSVPRGLLARALAFPLYSGAPNGFAFAVLWLLATLAVATVGVRELPAATPADLRLPAVVATLGGYLLAYAGTAALLVRGPLRRLLPVRQAWVVALVLATFGSTLLPLVGFFIDPANLQRNASFGPWLALNPWAATRVETAALAAKVALLWCGWVVAYGLRWWLRAARDFQSPAAGGGLPVAAALETDTVP